MDQELERKALIEQYKAYQQKLHSQGVAFNAVTDEQLEKLSVQDLSALIRQVKDLSRTPS